MIANAEDVMSDAKNPPIACDRCRSKKRKCDGLRPVCSNCLRAKAKPKGSDVICEYQPVLKRRGPSKNKRQREGHEVGSESRMNKKQNIDAGVEFNDPPIQAALGMFLNGAPGVCLNGQGFPVAEHASDTYPPGPIANSEKVSTSPEIIGRGLASSSESPDAENTSDNAHTMSTTQFLEFLHTSVNLPHPLNEGPATVMTVQHSPRRAGSGSHGMLPLDAAMWQQLLELPEGLTNPLPPPSIQMNLSSMSLDDNLFRMFDKSNDLLTILNGAPHCTLRAHPSNPPYQTLEDHLIAIFFTYVNIVMPVFKEDVFLRNYTPFNRHPPALLNAICGLACMYSNHPDLYSKHKSPMEASIHFMKQSMANMAHTKDRLAIIQSMCMVGMWEFGNLYGYESYSWIGRACREAQRMGIHLPNGQPNYPLSVFTSRYTVQWSDLELEERTRTWGSCFSMDFFASVVSGLPLSIDETGCLDLLQQREAEYRMTLHMRKNGAVNNEKSILESPESQIWIESFSTIPAFTIFDTRQGPSFSYSPYSRLALSDILSLDGREKQTPLHLVTSKYDDWHLIQLIYVMRRITRLQLKRPFSTSNLSTQTHAILSAMPTDPDKTQLHTALITWYSQLPNDWKPFNSLEDFRISKPNLPIPPPTGPHEPWVFSPVACITHLVFTGIFAVLHDPRSNMLFRPTPESPATVSALEICMLAFKAHVYILRCVFSSSGHASPPDLDDYLDVQSLPPPPVQISQNPALGFFSYGLSTHIMDALQLQLGVSTHGADELSKALLECIAAIREVMMPAVACLSRVWKVNDVYYTTMKQRVVNFPAVYR
ncbi:hypothetical protein HDU67_000583, partial [Dinochytrium kinnereticum]